ncbi:glucan endo-1,3-beta-glucosidase 2-like [Actinidia eriantha]|uniref:glucan endo-1,3-beta-glucosidase 2-like n=1 Tax=Actinidia eriantha TaxID=165200 RepID=UPI00258C6541|nr:glucan endo-1,3-beta-glucosidase 2-like [Actinidia eriantha]
MTVDLLCSNNFGNAKLADKFSTKNGIAKTWQLVADNWRDVLQNGCQILAIAVDCGSIGANYGRIANNLPSAVRVVQLIKSQGIERVKVYDTDPAVLKSLSGSGIKVTVDLPNELLLSAAKRQSFAYTWVQKNFAAYYPSTQIEAIAVSDEVLVDPHNTTRFLVPAMKNIHEALVKYKLDSAIKISSPIALSAQLLGTKREE